MAEPAEHQEHDLPFDPRAFYKHTTLEQLVSGKEPVQSVDQFAMEDLTDDEFDRFMRTLES